MNSLITCVNSFAKLAEAVRSGNACIPITNLSGGNDLMSDVCSSSLVVGGGECELRVRSLPPPNEAALMDSLIRDQDSNKSISELHCVLDGTLHTAIKHVGFTSSYNSMGHGTTRHFWLNSINLLDVECVDGSSSHISMVSKIARSKLNFENLKRTTKTECSLERETGMIIDSFGFGGDVSPYRYTIKRDGDDLEIVVKLIEGEFSISAEFDQEFMDALILCLNWINGGHPYIYYSKHEREESTVACTVHPLRQDPQCCLRLVRPKLGVNGAEKIMECGIRFFSVDSPLSEDLILFLWQYRDTTSEGPITYSKLLQACTLLEGVIGLTLRHSMGLSPKDIDILRMPGNTDGRKRTSNAGERFYHAGLHLGFDWVQEVEPVVTNWKSIRNSLAHGNLSDIKKQTPHAFFDSYDQMIQAFNAIVLRLIGYKGQVAMDGGIYAAPT